MWGRRDMKKFFSLLILPLVAVMCLMGCGDSKKVADIKKLYLSTIDEHKDNDTRIFFSDSERKYEICISYSEFLQDLIDNDSPSSSSEKRYRGLYYQQKVLDNIFAYYTNHQEEFFRVADSKDIKKDSLNTLYSKLEKLNSTLDDFVGHYNTLMDVSASGKILGHNITRYTYQLNKVIDASFNFMYEFHNVYSKYCVENYDQYSADNIGIYVDKAYLDLAYVVYMENIKAFNSSGSDNGICELESVVASSSKFNLLELLEDRKTLKEEIVNNLSIESSGYEETMEKLKAFDYSRDVFEQKLSSYNATYYSLDIRTISNYKFGVISGVDYEDYLQTMSPSERATITMLENFVKDNFDSYIDKLEDLVD